MSSRSSPVRLQSTLGPSVSSFSASLKQALDGFSWKDAFQCRVFRSSKVWHCANCVFTFLIDKYATIMVKDRRKWPEAAIRR